MLAILLLAPALMTHIANINIKGSAFQPDSIHIEVGDTVRWTQMDGLNHTATSTPHGGDGNWGSVTLTQQQNKTYDHVFSAPGVYTYDCEYHNFMRAKITVGNATAVAGLPSRRMAPEVEKALRDLRGRAMEIQGQAPGPNF